MTIENLQRSRYSSALKKVAVDIRGASVMFVRGMCISTLWSFSKSMSCKYFHVRSNLRLIDFELFMLKEIKYQKQV